MAENNRSQASQRTIDMSRVPKDRFQLPAGSLVRSQAGKMAYGMPGRPIARGAGRQAASSSVLPLWTPRQPRATTTQPKTSFFSLQNVQGAGKPESQRHDPYKAYIAAIHERERRQIERKAAAARSRAHTVYSSRGRGSPGVAEALSWVEPEPRPVTSRRVVSHPLAAQLNGILEAASPAAARPITGAGPLEGQFVARFAITSPRYAARAASEAQSAAPPPASESELARKQLERHAAKKAICARNQAETQALAENWPHGLPAVLRLSAEKSGMKMSGLGYGAMQSLPCGQFLAPRPTFKRP